MNLRFLLISGRLRCLHCCSWATLHTGKLIPQKYYWWLKLMLHHDRSGSTVIVLFPRNFMRFDEDLLKYSKEGLETVVKVGEQIGTRL